MDFYRKATLIPELLESQIGYDEQLYREEKITGHMNHALTQLMLANKVFPVYKSEE
jgi:glutaminase